MRYTHVILLQQYLYYYVILEYMRTPSGLQVFFVLYPLRSLDPHLSAASGLLGGGRCEMTRESGEEWMLPLAPNLESSSILAQNRK